MMRPTVIAHRGACRRAPENTVAAFELARELGSDWVELDVRRTADGALAVHHDAALADGRLIVDLAASDLPPDVPGLGAALDACRGMGVNIEIKNAPVDADFDPDRTLAGDVVALLADRGEISRCSCRRSTWRPSIGSTPSRRRFPPHGSRRASTNRPRRSLAPPPVVTSPCTRSC